MSGQESTPQGPEGWRPPGPSPGPPPGRPPSGPAQPGWGPGHPPPPAPPPGGPGWAPPPGGPPPAWGQPPTWGPPPGPPGPHPWGPPPKAIPTDIGRGAGPVPLRPLGLGDMLDGSFRLLRVNIRSLLILTALFVVPLQLLASFFQRDLLSVGFLSLLNDPLAAQGVADESVWSSVLAGGIGFLTAGFVLPLVTGGVCRLIGSSYLGEQSDHDAALRVAGRRAGALLGTWWLHLLILLVPLLPGVALLALAAAADSVGAAVLGVVVLLGGAVGMLLLVPLFVAAAPAVVIEHLGPVAALRRSRQLIRARYWPTLGVVVVTGLIFSTISSILASPFSLVGQLVGGSFAWVLVALGAIVGQLVSVPLTGIVATLVYFDGRIRTEGFDLQLLARSLGDPSPSADGWGGGR